MKNIQIIEIKFMPLQMHRITKCLTTPEKDVGPTEYWTGGFCMRAIKIMHIYKISFITIFIKMMTTKCFSLVSSSLHT